ncbi:MAG TPA: hypothetical protein RMG48_02840 [Myxococcales bacterium LLY-WYZ-16_1]|nr:hypothetical protein [Myxococcales bacterium LLY-WYZ-16_1]
MERWLGRFAALLGGLCQTFGCGLDLRPAARPVSEQVTLRAESSLTLAAHDGRTGITWVSGTTAAGGPVAFGVVGFSVTGDAEPPLDGAPTAAFGPWLGGSGALFRLPSGPRVELASCDRVEDLFAEGDGAGWAVCPSGVVHWTESGIDRRFDAEGLETVAVSDAGSVVVAGASGIHSLEPDSVGLERLSAEAAVDAARWTFGRVLVLTARSTLVEVGPDGLHRWDPELSEPAFAVVVDDRGGVWLAGALGAVRVLPRPAESVEPFVDTNVRDIAAGGTHLTLVGARIAGAGSTLTRTDLPLVFADDPVSSR